MVRLPFNAHGWQFQHSVEGLVRSFKLAASTIDLAIDQTEDAIRNYRQHIEQGGKPIGDWEETGETIWTQDQVLEWDLINAKDAAMALRKAYAVQFYHLWERSAQAWTGSGPNTSHGTLARKTLGEGYPINPKLEAVKHLANTLKHGNPKHGRMLCETWRALVHLSPLADDPALVADWYAVVELSEADVVEVASIVATSGPTAQISDLFAEA